MYVNLGYLNIAPRFNNVFETGGNRIAYNYEDQKVLGIEAGYGLKFNRFTAIVNIYRTQWQNKPGETIIPIALPSDETVNYRINKIDALHKGIELETNFKIIPQKLDWENAFSLGDWRYKTNDSAKIYDDVTGAQIGKTIFYSANNVHVGNAAQLQYSTSMRYEFIKDFYVKFRYTFFGKNYANFAPDALNGVNANRDSWKMPNYSMLDLFTGYEAKGPKSVRYNFTLGVTNALNNKYISDAQNGTDFTASTATVFFGQGRRFVAGVKVSF